MTFSNKTAISESTPTMPVDLAPATSRVGASDREFAELYEAHRRDLMRVAYLICGDTSMAEDAVAEAVVLVLPRWRRGRLDNPGAYLKRAVVNILMSKFRRQRRWRAYVARHGHNAEAFAPAADQFSKNEALLAALQELPIEQRTTLVLRFFHDLSEAETAEIMGVSPGTVKSRVSRGLERMRPALEQRSDLQSEWRSR